MQNKPNLCRFQAVNADCTKKQTQSNPIFTRRSFSEGGQTQSPRPSPKNYGVILGTDDTAAENADTSLLYAGEQYDSAIDQYYLRARYYNPWSGTFNRTDPFAGNNQDPQSLHKYLYCHANPSNAIDPSGEEFTLPTLNLRTTIGYILLAIFSSFLTNWPIMELKSLISSSFLSPRKLLGSHS